MAITTYPLNNIKYTAEDAETYLATRSSGVYENNDFPISVTGADNKVTIGEGLAWIRNSKFSGKSVAMKDAQTLDLGITASTSPRLDAIVLQYDINGNETKLIVKKGTESAQPKAPAVVRNGSFYELHLYHVLRKPSDTTIQQSAITDLRRNPDYCGIMMDELSQVDRTLTKDGFAADAGVVGRKLEEKLSKAKIQRYKETGTFTFSNEEKLVKSISIPANSLYSITFNQTYSNAPPRSVTLQASDGMYASNWTAYNNAVRLSATLSGYTDSTITLQIKSSCQVASATNGYSLSGFVIEL